MPPQPPSVTMAPGETLITCLSPRLSVFLWREATVLGLSALALLPLALLLRAPEVWALVPLVLLMDLFAGQTPLDWTRYRETRWYLTSHRLIEIDLRNPEAPRSIALERIGRLRRLMFWRLFVVAEDGEILTLAYVPALPELQQRLTDLRNAAGTK